jgi:hypothetical protein
MGIHVSRRASTCTIRCTSVTAGRDSIYTPMDTTVYVSISTEFYTIDVLVELRLIAGRYSNTDQRIQTPTWVRVLNFTLWHAESD